MQTFKHRSHVRNILLERYVDHDSEAMYHVTSFRHMLHVFSCCASNEMHGIGQIYNKLSYRRDCAMRMMLILVWTMCTVH